MMMKIIVNIYGALTIHQALCIYSPYKILYLFPFYRQENCEVLSNRHQGTQIVMVETGFKPQSSGSKVFPFNN